MPKLADLIECENCKVMALYGHGAAHFPDGWRCQNCGHIFFPKATVIKLPIITED